MWGYGLVEVPRRVWNSAYTRRMLSYTYFKIAKLSLEKTESEETLEDVLDVGYTALQQHISCFVGHQNAIYKT